MILQSLVNVNSILLRSKTFDFSFFDSAVSLSLIKSLLLMVVVVSVASNGIAQKETAVAEITASTGDLIRFQVIAPKSAEKGRDVSVDYVVSNRSKRTVYLVTIPNDVIRVRESWIFEFVEPVVVPDDHLPFEYEFVPILPGGLYRGRFVLPHRFITSSGLEELSNLTIRFGFSYRLDRFKLKDCKTTTYVLPCLNEVYDKSKSLTVGNVVVALN